MSSVTFTGNTAGEIPLEIREEEEDIVSTSYTNKLRHAKHRILKLKICLVNSLISSFLTERPTMSNILACVQMFLLTVNSNTGSIDLLCNMVLK